jgi:putative oligopeptide ABC transporter ATP-binding protein
MKDKINCKSFTKKIKTYFVGNKCHNKLDNLITLSRSNNDEYDSVMDYLFYVVLNLTPEQYLNSIELTDYEPDENEIKILNKNFFNYKEKVKLSSELNEQLNKMVDYIREKALSEKRIEKIGNKYIPNEYYNMYYLQKKMFLFYKENKEWKE